MMDCDLNDKRYIRRFQNKVLRAKYRCRSKLTLEDNGWQKHDYANSFDMSISNINENIQRIDRNVVSVESFRENFEKPNIPVIIMNDQKNWAANYKWIKSRLKLKYRNQEFRCGDDDSGRSVKLKMKYYVDYVRVTKDDSPLYIFDGNLDRTEKKKRLLEDYSISDYFYEDLFSIVGEKKRPPYRWFVMGPKRSGTGIHIDPLGTSAWNALVKGYKRWCLFPPCTPKFLIKPYVDPKWKNISEAIGWFDVIYSRFKNPDWPAEYAMVEAIQRPGDTIFVPSGWWHVVLNVTNTVAITQNFCSTINFPTVWLKTSEERKHFSKLWYRKLAQFRPDLCTLADVINLEHDVKTESQSSSNSSSSSDSNLSILSKKSYSSGNIERQSTEDESLKNLTMENISVNKNLPDRNEWNENLLLTENNLEERLVNESTSLSKDFLKNIVS